MDAHEITVMNALLAKAFGSNETRPMDWGNHEPIAIAIDFFDSEDELEASLHE